MTADPLVIRELHAAGLTIDEEIPLSRIGSFQLGGTARCVVQVPDRASMGTVMGLLTQRGISAVLLGEGTNLLFSDQGWSGVLVRCAGGEQLPESIGSGKWRVQASMNLESLVHWAIANSLSGLEPFVGIPGAVGGAVVGNAGAWGVQMADRLEEVSGWLKDGTPFRWTSEDCGFTYRDSLLKQQESWVSEVVLTLTDGDQATLQAEQTRILTARAARHPPWQEIPCIGSFFKNLAPSSAAGRRQAAGWFLEEAGAKAMTVGGAAVFSGHANIPIKAHPGCTASDIAHLALRMKEAVLESHGIELEREVRYLGQLPGYQGQHGFW